MNQQIENNGQSREQGEDQKRGHGQLQPQGALAPDVAAPDAAAPPVAAPDAVAKACPESCPEGASEVFLLPAPIPGPAYRTSPAVPTVLGRLLPSVIFYLKYLWVLFRDGMIAYFGRYSPKHWIRASYDVTRALEESGLVFNIEGLDNIRRENGPFVFVANHMSTLETVALPGLIRPRVPLSFVVKKSLLSYPFLGPVLSNCQPIGVGRKNARQDLQDVLEKGAELLASGVSVFIFPQSTRSPGLDARTFNSIGVKLARRAGVAVMPVAIRSDAWPMGKLLKDFGKLEPCLPTHFCFGQPFTIQGNGKAEQARVFNFIAGKMREWNLPVIEEDPGEGRQQGPLP